MATDTKVPIRLRLGPLTARKLAIAAEIRGQTVSDLVEWALLPHLAFDLPELPDVDARPLGRGGEAGANPSPPRPGRRRSA